MLIITDLKVYVMRNVYEKWRWLRGRYLINCHIGQELFSTAQQLLAASPVTLWRSLYSWMIFNTFDPVGSRSCMSRPYVDHTQPLYLRRAEGKAVVSQQATTSTKLGQFLVMTITRAEYLVEWKGIVAVSIVFLEWGWRGSGNGTRPCFTKRIMKTKQLWQVWNLRTLPGRYEDYQPRCLLKGLQPAVPCALVIEKKRQFAQWILHLNPKARLLSRTPQSGNHLNKALLSTAEEIVLKTTNK